VSGMAGTPLCVICEKAKIRIPANRTCDDFHCRQEYQRWLQAKKPVCAICGKLLRIQASANPVCDSDTCSMQWTGLTRAGPGIAMARCQVCGVFTIRRNAEECMCRDSACAMIQNLVLREERQRIEAEKYQKLVADAETLRDRLVSEKASGANANHYAVIVPHTSAKMGPPNQESVRQFRHRLAEMVATAIHEPEQDSDWPRRPEDMPDPASPSELPVFTQACTGCRGNCCHMGADHAFLSIGIMRRYIRQHPEMSADQVVDVYSSHLPKASLEDSCIFHTDRGCNLPREMRSDLCNQFICKSLREIRNEIGTGTRGFFLVPEEDGEFFDSCFVDTPSSGNG